MSARALILAAVSLGAPSLAGAQALADRDTLLVDAAAVPHAGNVRLSAGGGASSSTAASTAGSASIGAGIQVTLLPGFALGFSGYVDAGKVTPAAVVRYQLLNQADHLLNLSALARYKSVGFSPQASELEAGLSVGRRFGVLDLMANGVVGKGLGADTGTDLEGKLGAGFIVGEAGRIGVDARLQSELADNAPVIAPPVGRDFDLMAGPTASVVIQRVQLQAFAGYAAPRHTFRTGPAALGMVSVDF